MELYGQMMLYEMVREFKLYSEDTYALYFINKQNILERINGFYELLRLSSFISILKMQISLVLHLTALVSCCMFLTDARMQMHG